MRMIGYFRLGLVRVNDCPVGLEPSTGTIIEENAKKDTSDSYFVPKNINFLVLNMNVNL